MAFYQSTHLDRSPCRAVYSADEIIFLLRAFTESEPPPFWSSPSACQPASQNGKLDAKARRRQAGNSSNPWE